MVYFRNVYDSTKHTTPLLLSLIARIPPPVYYKWLFERMEESSSVLDKNGMTCLYVTVLRQLLRPFCHFVKKKKIRRKD